MYMIIIINLNEYALNEITDIKQCATKKQFSDKNYEVVLIIVFLSIFNKLHWLLIIDNNLLVTLETSVSAPRSPPVYF